MGDVVGAAAERAAIPGVDEVEDQRRVDADGRVQARPAARRGSARRRRTRRRVPVGVQRHAAAVAGDDVARVGQARDLDLQPLDRRIDVARPCRRRRPPRPARATARAPGAARARRRAASTLAEQREAELEVRREPLGLEADSRRAAGRRARRRSPATTKCGSMKRSCSSRAPAHQPLRRTAASRSARPARAAAAAAPGSCARAAASRRRAARPGPAGRVGCRASTACRCRTRRGACCR